MCTEVLPAFWFDDARPETVGEVGVRACAAKAPVVRPGSFLAAGTGDFAAVGHRAAANLADHAATLRLLEGCSVYEILPIMA